MKNYIVPFKQALFTVIEKDGEPFFLLNEVCNYLKISNAADSANSLKDVVHKIKLTYEESGQLGLADLQHMQVGTKGTILLTEAGLYKLVFKSRKPEAEELGDWVAEVVLPTLRKTGKFDMIEQQIQLVVDEKEKELKQKVYAFENVLKITPNDMFALVGLNSAKTELEAHLTKVRIEEVNEKIEFLDAKVKRATVLREGDLSPDAVSRRYNVFSINDNPHPKFAECMARELGFYIKPEGNAGYQDEFVSVNFTDRNGVTVPLLKYSKQAIKTMDEYIEENGLTTGEPPIMFVRGIKKGNYNFTYMLFTQHDIRIKINETTYKLYSKANKI